MNTPKLGLMMTTAILASCLSAQAPADFGFGKLTVNGTPARGTHPLAIVLMQYDSAPAAGIAVAPPLAYNASYYQQLFFDNPVNSINAQYAEMSGGLFRWVPAGAGVYGPFNVPGADWDPDSPTNKSSKRLHIGLQLLASAGFNFDAFDANGDGTITKDELTVMIIDNIGLPQPAGGANRNPNPQCWVPDGQNSNVCPTVINAGDRASQMTYTHELAHQLGTIDLYGSAGENYEYSLMSATIFQTSPTADILDDRRRFHLDPWHKMLLGWTMPAIYSLDADGSATINAAQIAVGSSVILYSPAKGFLEYWLLEFRSATRPNGRGYDANVGGYGADQTPPPSGLVLWHVQTNVAVGEDLVADMTGVSDYSSPGATMWPVYMVGAPNFKPGGGTAWPPNTLMPYTLSWLDGGGRRVQIQVGNIINGGDALEVSWHAPVPTPIVTRENILIYSESSGSAVTGYVDDPTAAFNQQKGYPGAFGAWTNVVPGGAGVLFYNSVSGALALGEVYGDGTYQLLDNLGATFSKGWSSVVYHKGYWFFYSQRTGNAIVGNFQNGQFHQYNGWTTFATGWTNIVDTPNGLLFYNAFNGSAAVGDWSYVSAGTGFGTIVKVNFVQHSSYPDGLSTGWTHIVNTNNGVLFYNSASGLEVMVDVLASGVISTRLATVATIAKGYTAIAADNQNIMFYNGASGDVAIGAIRNFGAGAEEPELPQLIAGSLEIRSLYPAQFQSGWTHLLATVPPAPPLQ